MGTNTIIGLVVAAAVVGGGAYYLSSNSEVTQETTQNTEETSGTSTFGALLALGGSRVCDVAVTTDGTRSEGTVHVSGSNVRSDITTTVNGKAIVGHMIQADGYIYSWSDAAPQGVKIKADQSQQSGSPQNQGVDPNAQVEYDCDIWVATQSTFDVPSNISFMEIGAGASGGAAGTLPAGVPTNIPSGMLPSY